MNEPTWITLLLIEAIHIDLLRVHGGRPGYRDKSLVETSLNRPLHLWRYDPDADLFNLAAAYGFALSKNHGFVDGNKRVAFMAMYVFLALNGYEINASEEEVVTVMVKLSSGSLNEPELARWLRNNTGSYKS